MNRPFFTSRLNVSGFTTSRAARSARSIGIGKLTGRLGEGRTYDLVRFRNGYSTDAPEMDVEFLGVDMRQDCYAIRLGKILSLKRWPG
jgi:hypothetical protein